MRVQHEDPLGERPRYISTLDILFFPQQRSQQAKTWPDRDGPGNASVNTQGRRWREERDCRLLVAQAPDHGETSISHKSTEHSNENLKVINRFLEQAYNNHDGNLELCIVWTKDILQITLPSRPPVQDYQASLESDHLNHEYHEILAEHPRLMENRWLVLDSESAHADTLQLGWQEEPNPTSPYKRAYSIRICFSSSLHHMATFDRGTASSLTCINNAQICGGVLRADLLQSITQKQALVSINAIAPDPSPERKQKQRDEKFPPWPVFCTTEVPLEVRTAQAMMTLQADHLETQILNKFITVTLADEVWQSIYETWGRRVPIFAIVNDLDPENCEDINGPFQFSPLIPPQIIGASPEAVNSFLKSHFTNSSLRWTQFVILDNVSVQDGTVLIADEGGNAFDGLQLARLPFTRALSYLNACGPTSLQVQLLAESGARSRDGVTKD